MTTTAQDLLSNAKPIPGHPDYYATEDGRIITTLRGLRIVNGAPIGNEVPVHVYIHEADIVVLHSRARLVCETFNGPPPSTFHVATHISSDFLDDRPINLCWKVPEGELRTGKGFRRLASPTNAKLTASQVQDIRRRIKAGESNRLLAREYGVATRSIINVGCGKSWKHLAVEG